VSSATDILSRYFSYRRRSVNRHGVHSPFAYEIVENVLRPKSTLPFSTEIESYRQLLRKSSEFIPFEEMGAGNEKANTRAVKDIAKKSLSTKRQCAILARAVTHFRATSILELGTSLGIATSYMASTGAQVYTIEGNQSVSDLASKGWESLNLSSKVHSSVGRFTEQLPFVLEEMGQVDLAFIDGNHQREPTLDYFNTILPYANKKTVFIFDDIHWSKGMEQAWEELKAHPSVHLTIDCFWMGMAFIDPGLSGEHFTIRY